MNDKNKQRHMAYEAMMVLMQIALLTFIIRLWPILLLMILGIFVAALRLLFLSSKKIEPVKPIEALPPSAVPPTDTRSSRAGGRRCSLIGLRVLLSSQYLP